MWNIYLEKLYQMLKGNETHTLAELAEGLGFSTKTMRKLLTDFKAETAGSGAELHMKHGQGYRLQIYDVDKFRSFRCENRYQNSIPTTSEGRVQYLLEYFLHNSGYTKLDDLCEKLFISKRTLTINLKEVEALMAHHHLRLIRKPGYGVRLEGDEFHMRMCIANHFMAKDVGEEEQEKFKIISETVASALSENHMRISDMMYQNLIMHIYIAVKRIEAGNHMPADGMEVTYSPDGREYGTARRIVSDLSEKMGIIFPDNEIDYLVIHLRGKESGENNLVISEAVSDIASAMLERVNDIFCMDFRKNLEVRMNLCRHLVPLCIRLQYGMKVQNPLLQDIKRRYAMAYNMAGCAVEVLAERYKKNVESDEIGYIALVFQLALEKQGSGRKGKNILLVCSTGKGSARLLAYRLQKTFGEMVERVDTCDVNGISEKDFSDIDYVFTTVPISVRVPVPIQEITYILEDGELNMLKRWMEMTGDSRIVQYYHEDMFIPDMRHESVQGVLQTMCRCVMEKRGLDQAFLDAVLEREHMAVTAFGNMVAMPHPCRTVSEDTFVCVGILEQPIAWGTQKVQVVFLVSIGKEADNNLQHFYQITSEYLLRKREVKNLIRNRRFHMMMEDLQSIEKEYERGEI